jgi:PhoH-like ATPase
MEVDMGKIYVVDTNVILNDAHFIETLSDNSENLIVIPETVLDEIDSKKMGFDEINFQAREFARMLSESKLNDVEKNDIITIIETDIENKKTNRKTKIEIWLKEEYEADKFNYEKNILNDRKILEIAKDVEKKYNDKDVIFVSNDIMARTRALSYGLKTENIYLNKNDEELVFHKTIEIDDELSPSGIHLKEIKKFDPDHKPYNFSYTFKLPSGQELLGIIKNERIELIDEKELRRQDVSPKNKEQLFFSAGVLDDYFKIVVTDAVAGSGKTLLAISGALKLIKSKQYQKIVYIRNSIESIDKGEDVGYLPGLEEKFRIYNHPLYDSLEYIIRQELKKKKNSNSIKESEINAMVSEKIEEYKLKYGIETMWVGELRGRTISNAIVIVDEAQNISNKTLQLILSRIDETCKVIIVGSTLQIDNPYLNKYTNSLTTLLNSLKEKHDEVNIFGVKLHKVLRGPITEWAEKVFGNYKRKK